MNTGHKRGKNLIAIIVILLTGVCGAADQIITPDMSKVNSDERWGLYNRQAAVINQNGTPQIQLNGQSGAGGLIWSPFDFTNGIIECEIKGQSKRPSFVGIFFHGLDPNTYDAIYFRPFNFLNDQRKQHSVQYISHPQHTWHGLRKSHPGKHEAAISHAPDPEGFFHAKLVIESPKVKVYVNDISEPVLVVDQLNQQQSGVVGCWVGNQSAGTFANLKITPAEQEAPTPTDSTGG